MCGHCGERSDIFSYGGGEKAAEKFKIPFLGRIPIDPAIREGGDSGTPLVIGDPASPQTKAFKDVASALVAEVDRMKGSGDEKTGSLTSMLKKLKDPMGLK